MSAKTPEPQKNAPQGEPRPPKLFVRVQEGLRYKRYSIRTEQSYVHWIKRCVRFHHKRHLGEMQREAQIFR